MNSTLHRAFLTAATVTTFVVQTACMPQHTRTTTSSPSEPDPASTTRQESPVRTADAPAQRLVPPVPVSVSPGVAEVITLVQGGVEESVIKAHMMRSTNAFNPTVDELVYLNDIGVPGNLVSTLIQQTVRQREQAAMVAGAAAAANPPAAQPARAGPPEVPAAVAQPAAPVVAEPAQPQAVQPVPAQAVVVQPQPQVVVVQQQLPAHVSYFHNTLSPYGTWIEIAPHGWCWQPTVAVSYPRWRPYADRGRWLWTSSGWYWQSDYSWGWAPFHYGRWVLNSRAGWVWVPDLTWGPAWVTWRYSDAYCGWAPLPPGTHYIAGHGLHHNGLSVGITFDFGLASSHFSFVSWRRFCDRNPHYYLEPARTVQNIYNNTTIINNYGSSNNLVVNNGVPPQRVQALARTELKEVLIKAAPISAGTVVKPDRLEKEGSQLVLYRPQLQTSAPAPAPALQANTSVPPGTVPVYANGSKGPVVTGYTSDPASIASGFPVSVPLPLRNSNAPTGSTAAAASQPQSIAPAISTSRPQATPAPTLNPATPSTNSVPVAPGPNARPRPIGLQPAQVFPSNQSSPTKAAGAVVKPDSVTKPTPTSAGSTIPSPIVITPPTPTAPRPGASVPPQRPTTTQSQPAPTPSRPTLVPAPSQPTPNRPVATPQPAPIVAPSPATVQFPTPSGNPPNSAPVPVRTTPSYTLPAPRAPTPSFTPAPTPTFTPAPTPRPVVSSPAPAAPAPPFTPSPSSRPAPSYSAPAPAPSIAPASRSTPAPSGPVPSSAPSLTPAPSNRKPEQDKKQ